MQKVKKTRRIFGKYVEIYKYGIHKDYTLELERFTYEKKQKIIQENIDTIS